MKRTFLIVLRPASALLLAVLIALALGLTFQGDYPGAALRSWVSVYSTSASIVLLALGSMWIGYWSLQTSTRIARDTMIAATTAWLGYCIGYWLSRLLLNATAAVVIPLKVGSQSTVTMAGALEKGLGMTIRHSPYDLTDAMLLFVSILFVTAGVTMGTRARRQNRASSATNDGGTAPIDATARMGTRTLIKLAPALLAFAASVIGSVLAYLAAISKPTL